MNTINGADRSDDGAQLGRWRHARTAHAGHRGVDRGLVDGGQLAPGPKVLEQPKEIGLSGRRRRLDRDVGLYGLFPGDDRTSAKDGAPDERALNFATGFFREPAVSRARRLSNPLTGSGSDDLPELGAFAADELEGHRTASFSRASAALS